MPKDTNTFTEVWITVVASWGCQRIPILPQRFESLLWPVEDTKGYQGIKGYQYFHRGLNHCYRQLRVPKDTNTFTEVWITVVASWGCQRIPILSPRFESLLWPVEGAKGYQYFHRGLNHCCGQLRVPKDTNTFTEVWITVVASWGCQRIPILSPRFESLLWPVEGAKGYQYFHQVWITVVASWGMPKDTNTFTEVWITVVASWGCQRIPILSQRFESLLWPVEGAKGYQYFHRGLNHCCGQLRIPKDTNTFTEVWITVCQLRVPKDTNTFTEVWITVVASWGCQRIPILSPRFESLLWPVEGAKGYQTFTEVWITTVCQLRVPKDTNTFTEVWITVVASWGYQCQRIPILSPRFESLLWPVEGAKGYQYFHRGLNHCCGQLRVPKDTNTFTEVWITVVASWGCQRIPILESQRFESLLWPVEGAKGYQYFHRGLNHCCGQLRMPKDTNTFTEVWITVVASWGCPKDTNTFTEVWITVVASWGCQRIPILSPRFESLLWPVEDAKGYQYFHRGLNHCYRQLRVPKDTNTFTEVWITVVASWGCQRIPILSPRFESLLWPVEGAKGYQYFHRGLNHCCGQFEGLNPSWGYPLSPRFESLLWPVEDAKGYQYFHRGLNHCCGQLRVPKDTNTFTEVWITVVASWGCQRIPILSPRFESLLWPVEDTKGYQYFHRGLNHCCGQLRVPKDTNTFTVEEDTNTLNHCCGQLRMPVEGAKGYQYFHRGLNHCCGQLRVPKDTNTSTEVWITVVASWGCQRIPILSPRFESLLWTVEGAKGYQHFHWGLNHCCGQLRMPKDTNTFTEVWITVVASWGCQRIPILPQRFESLLWPVEGAKGYQYFHRGLNHCCGQLRIPRDTNTFTEVWITVVASWGCQRIPILSPRFESLLWPVEDAKGYQYFHRGLNHCCGQLRMPKDTNTFTEVWITVVASWGCQRIPILSPRFESLLWPVEGAKGYQYFHRGLNHCCGQFAKGYQYFHRGLNHCCGQLRIPKDTNTFTEVWITVVASWGCQRIPILSPRFESLLWPVEDAKGYQYFHRGLNHCCGQFAKGGLNHCCGQLRIPILSPRFESLLWWGCQRIPILPQRFESLLWPVEGAKGYQYFHRGLNHCCGQLRIPRDTNTFTEVWGLNHCCGQLLFRQLRVPKDTNTFTEIWITVVASWPKDTNTFTEVWITVVASWGCQRIPILSQRFESLLWPVEDAKGYQYFHRGLNHCYRQLRVPKDTNTFTEVWITVVASWGCQRIPILSPRFESLLWPVEGAKGYQYFHRGLNHCCGQLRMPKDTNTFTEVWITVVASWGYQGIPILLRFESLLWPVEGAKGYQYFHRGLNHCCGQLRVPKDTNTFTEVWITVVASWGCQRIPILSPRFESLLWPVEDAKGYQYFHRGLNHCCGQLRVPKDTNTFTEVWITVVASWGLNHCCGQLRMPKDTNTFTEVWITVVASWGCQRIPILPQRFESLLWPVEDAKGYQYFHRGLNHCCGQLRVPKDTNTFTEVWITVVASWGCQRIPILSPRFESLLWPVEGAKGYQYFHRGLNHCCGQLRVPKDTNTFTEVWITVVASWGYQGIPILSPRFESLLWPVEGAKGYQYFHRNHCCGQLRMPKDTNTLNHCCGQLRMPKDTNTFTEVWITVVASWGCQRIPILSPRFESLLWPVCQRIPILSPRFESLLWPVEDTRIPILPRGLNHCCGQLRVPKDTNTFTEVWITVVASWGCQRIPILSPRFESLLWPVEGAKGYQYFHRGLNHCCGQLRVPKDTNTFTEVWITVVARYQYFHRGLNWGYQGIPILSPRFESLLWTVEGAKGYQYFHWGLNHCCGQLRVPKDTNTFTEVWGLNHCWITGQLRVPKDTNTFTEVWITVVASWGCQRIPILSPRFESLLWPVEVPKDTQYCCGQLNAKGYHRGLNHCCEVWISWGCQRIPTLSLRFESLLWPVEDAKGYQYFHRGLNHCCGQLRVPKDTNTSTEVWITVVASWGCQRIPILSPRFESLLWPVEDTKGYQYFHRGLNHCCGQLRVPKDTNTFTEVWITVVASWGCQRIPILSPRFESLLWPVEDAKGYQYFHRGLNHCCGQLRVPKDTNTFTEVWITVVASWGCQRIPILSPRFESLLWPVEGAKGYQYFHRGLNHCCGQLRVPKDTNTFTEVWITVVASWGYQGIPILSPRFESLL